VSILACVALRGRDTRLQAGLSHQPQRSTMFGRTVTPQKGAPAGHRMSDSSAQIVGPLGGVATLKSSLGAARHSLACVCGALYAVLQITVLTNNFNGLLWGRSARSHYRSSPSVRPSVSRSVCLSVCLLRAPGSKIKTHRKTKFSVNVHQSRRTGVPMFNSKGQGQG